MRDPYAPSARSYLKSALRNRKKAWDILGTTENTKDAKKKFESAYPVVVTARKDILAALDFAIQYVDNVQYDKMANKRDASRLVEQVEAVITSLDDEQIVVDALAEAAKQPAKPPKQKTWMRNAKEKALEEAGNQILEALLNAATAHAVEIPVAILTGLPPGSAAALRWSNGATRELAAYASGKFRQTRQRYYNAGDRGQCTGPYCHQCQRGLTCQHAR